MSTSGTAGLEPEEEMGDLGERAGVFGSLCGL